MISFRVVGVLACGLLTACNTMEGGRRGSEAEVELRRGGMKEAASERALYSDLIRGMIDQQNYYAALAHIQEQQRLQGGTPELRYLEGEVRRLLGQDEAAETLYRGLLRSSMAGSAHHGLGLLYAGRDLPRALEHLRQAVSQRPTDAGARNDYGYALLRAGRHDDALTELATAVELDPQMETARSNLLLLMLVSGDEVGARRIVETTAMPAAAVERLRRQAKEFQQSRGDTVRGG